MSRNIEKNEFIAEEKLKEYKTKLKCENIIALEFQLKNIDMILQKKNGELDGMIHQNDEFGVYISPSILNQIVDDISKFKAEKYAIEEAIKYFREKINKEGCRVVARKMSERDVPGVTQDVWQNIRKHLGGKKSRKNKSKSKRTHKRKTINKKKHHKKSKRNHH